MLRELHISNLAVIADAKIELVAGLNCFTGATGAGKSLVIGAIEVLLGLRNPTEMLRPGAGEGRITGVFEVADRELLRKVEKICDAPIADDGGELLLVRRLHTSGRSSLSLNGNPITLGMLKQLAEHLVDVHGQHDHQYLLKPSNQIDVIDHFANLLDLRGKYERAYHELQAANQQLAELSANRTLRDQQLELYRFQADEIDNADLSAGEYEEISARASVLRNLERLTKEATATHSALYATEGSVLERCKMMAAILAELAMLDQNLRPVAGGLRDAAIGLEEVAFDLSRYLDKLDLDPAEVTEVEDRLNVLNRLQSKYGQTTEQVLLHREELRRQITELEKATVDLTSLQDRIASLKKELQAIGKELGVKRQAAAKRLNPAIETELAELGMEKAKFTIVLTPVAEPLASGLDQIEFIAQTNPGQLAQPLRKIASGGELSRVMLALKGILAQGDRVSVLVFDEIDANVGGRLGSIIGSKLRKLAARHQVLCITHLPQIASFADRHLTVRKEVANGSAAASVRTIDGDERIEELAEMISGQRVTDTTRAQARELLGIATGDAAVAVKIAPPVRAKAASRAKPVRK